ATAALEAGAKLLIIANHTAAPFSEFVGNEDNSDIPLVVASIGKGEGDKLIQAIEQGNTVLNVESTINTPYLYDLIDVHTKKIPATYQMVKVLDMGSDMISDRIF